MFSLNSGLACIREEISNDFRFQTQRSQLGFPTAIRWPSAEIPSFKLKGCRTGTGKLLTSLPLATSRNSSMPSLAVTRVLPSGNQTELLWVASRVLPSRRRTPSGKGSPKLSTFGGSAAFSAKQLDKRNETVSECQIRQNMNESH